MSRAATENREPVFDPPLSRVRKTCWYLMSFQGLIDMASALPLWFYLIAVKGSFHNLNYSMQSFRALRIFRLFKVGGKFLATLLMFYRAIRLAVEPLLVIAFGLLLSLVIFGIVFYELEGGIYKVDAGYPSGAFIRTSPDRMSPSSVESVFDSVPTSIYYAGVSMTTLGFGDLYPYTRSGRAFAVIVAVLGVLLFSLPMTVVFTHFDREYQKYVRIAEIKKNFSSAVNREIKQVDNDTPLNKVEMDAPNEESKRSAKEISFRSTISAGANNDNVRESIISSMAVNHVEQYAQAHSPRKIEIASPRSVYPYGGLEISSSRWSISPHRSPGNFPRRRSTTTSSFRSVVPDYNEEISFDDVTDDELQQYAIRLLSDYKMLKSKVHESKAAVEETIKQQLSLLNLLK
jgi:hypothetical protein